MFRVELRLVGMLQQLVEKQLCGEATLMLVLADLSFFQAVIPQNPQVEHFTCSLPMLALLEQVAM
jgi:hypothetical protein